MLISKIRNKSKGFIAYFIVGLISLTFVIVAASGLITAPNTIIVASVDDNDISKNKFLNIYNRQKKRFQEQLGEKYDAKFDKRLKESALFTLINQNLLNDLADKLDYATASYELQAFIRNNPAFQDDGAFSMQKYQQLLRINGYNPARYEADISAQLKQNQIENNFLNSAFITPSALKQMQDLSSQQREFSYMQIEIDDYLQAVIIKAKQVEDFYQKNKKTFVEEKKVKVNFVELSLEKISSEIKPTEKQLQDFYAEEKSNFTTSSERKAQHILLADYPLAEKVSALLAKGEDFAKLAEQYSEDAGSKDKAGDLGFFSKGVMVPEFEAKVFSMKVDEISKPVQSEFGYHIIKLNAIKAAQTQSFTAVKPELIDLYSKRQGQKILYNQAEELANLAYEDSLEEISEKMNLSLNTSEFFTQKSTIYDSIFINTAFTDVVLDNGENSEMVEVVKDKFVVMRLNEKIPQKDKTFAQVKDEINTHLKTLTAKKLVDDIGKKISKALSQGKKTTAEDLISEHNLKWKKVGWVGRDFKAVEAALANKVFALPRPSKGKSVYAVQNLDAKRIAIIQLSAVKIGKPDDNLAKDMLEFETKEMLSNVLKNLRNKAEIKVFSQRL